MSGHVHDRPGGPGCRECRGRSLADRAKYDPAPADDLATVSYRLRHGLPLTAEQLQLARFFTPPDPLRLAWEELQAAAAEQAEVQAQIDAEPSVVLGGFAHRRQLARLRPVDQRVSAAILAFGVEHDAAFGEP